MNRVAELRAIILRAKQAYYFTSSPLMDNPDYDALEQELEAISPLGPDDPVLTMVGCPVPPDAILTKAEHSMPMISQDKVNTEAEFRKWYTEKAVGQKLHVSLKGDGSSVAAYYTDGFLTQGISRGDGHIGEDVTANVMKFKGLPAYIETEDGPFTGSIRFEAILTKADWKTVGGKNPRNQGSGIVGRKDGVQAEFITAFAFDVSSADTEFASETEKMQLLQLMGVNVMPWTVCDTADEAVEFYTTTMESRGDGNNGILDFWIDGVVIKIDDLEVQDQIGFAPSGKYHKAQIAWKPEEEGAETVLRNVVLTGGHDGGIYPNARFDSVELGGTTVSNALLNNWEEIARLGVAIGDTIFVVKANEIVPKLRRVVHRPEDRKEILEPTICPFCGSSDVGRKQTQKGEGAVTMCFNPDCPAKQDRKLRNWFKKVEILGVGDSVRAALQEQLNIFTAADIYTLGREITVEQLRDLIISGESRFGHNADYLVEQINQKRDLPLHIFLGSLGIEGLGRREVEIACEKAPELGTLAAWRGDKLRDEDFAAFINAPSKAVKWADGIASMSDVIDGLLANGVTVQDYQSAEPTGIAVCITGTLPSGKKKAEYKEPLEAAGLTLVSKVSKDLAFLVVADPSKSTNKTQKVEKYNAKGANIKVISEDELVALL